MLALALALGTSPLLQQLKTLAPEEPAAVETVRGEAAPARLTAAQAVGKLCADAEPVLIIDTFVSDRVEPVIDADGDGKPDFEHGDVLAALYKASGLKFITRDLRGQRDIPHVADVFEDVAAGVESGRLRISAVNLSHAVDVNWSGLNADLELKTPVTRENIASRREELGQAVIGLMERSGSADFGRLVAAVGRLTARGVPVFVAAGNFTAEKVNLLGLMPGVVSVGALNRAGEKAAFSADSSLVEAWGPGEHVFRRLPEGLDVNGDGRADVEPSKLSGGPALAWRFAGKPLAEVRGKLPDDPWLDNIDRKNANGLQYLQDKMEDKLYSVEELNAFYRVSPLKARSFASRGKWFDKTMQYPFEADASGRVTFDPERSGAAGQAVLIPGTSFVAPALCWARR